MPLSERAQTLEDRGARQEFLSLVGDVRESVKGHYDALVEEVQKFNAEGVRAKPDGAFASHLWMTRLGFSDMLLEGVQTRLAHPADETDWAIVMSHIATVAAFYGTNFSTEPGFVTGGVAELFRATRRILQTLHPEMTVGASVTAAEA
jgi:hypothetical protein